MIKTATRSGLACEPDTLPEGFPYAIEADGSEWLWTGKLGTNVKTGQVSAEYGTDAVRYWRLSDGTIEEE